MEGQLGSCPDWYPLIRAARYLGVPPWDLASQPDVWRGWALAAEAAEAEAAEEVAKRQQGSTSKWR